MTLSRHDVNVVHEFQPVPPLTVEKAKVLQILTNLIRNAKFACDDARKNGSGEKTITLGIEPAPGDRVRLIVRDTGIGIPRENLTRIFSHGFTTRSYGHGFGLHSSALAAKEMQGSLTVFSAGPGQGATFTLELPLAPAADSAPPANGHASAPAERKSTRTPKPWQVRVARAAATPGRTDGR